MRGQDGRVGDGEVSAEGRESRRPTGCQRLTVDCAPARLFSSARAQNVLSVDREQEHAGHAGHVTVARAS